MEHKRVILDCAIDMVKAIDKEAEALHVSRQALIKMWLGEMVKKLRNEVKEN